MRRRQQSSNCISAPKPEISTSHELRETPIEPDPNPKKTLIVPSASSAASGSGQQRVKGSGTDAEPATQIGAPRQMITDRRVALPRALAANTGRRIAEKSCRVSNHHTRRNCRVS